MAHCWTIILYFTMVFNLNYGPFGKGNWFNEKVDWVTSFRQECDHTSALWLKYAGKIAKDSTLVSIHHALLIKPDCLI